MRQFFKKALILLLCLSVLLTVVLVCQEKSGSANVDAARTVADVDKDIKEVEALINKIKAEMQDLKSKIAALDKQTVSNEQKAQLLAQQVLTLETEMELNESMLQSCDMKRSTAMAERIIVENEYQYYQELFSELMRFIYENGTMTDFELLFTSGSLTDYLNRRDDFNSIMDCVNDMTESIAASKSHLEDLELEYQEAADKYQEALDELDESKKELLAAQEELEQYADEIGSTSEAIAKKYAELSETLSEAQAKLKKLREEREVLYQKQQSSTSRSDYIAPTKTSSKGFAWPLEMGISYRISSYFATRTNPITGQGTEFHQGLDIACNKGTRILASKAGVVTKAAEYGGYGNCVIIYHGVDSNGRSITTLYGHASQLKCVKNQQVKQGDVIALVGSTGRSTGNHLHFSVLINDEYVDPDDYLPDGYYKKMPNS